MSRERNPLCSRCGVRPRIPKQAYCRECRATLSLEWYHKKHPEAKWCDPAAAAALFRSRPAAAPEQSAADAAGKPDAGR